MFAVYKYCIKLKCFKRLEQANIPWVFFRISDHSSSSPPAVRSLRRTSSDGVRFTILKPEPPTRALGSLRRKGKRKSSFQSDHSRCAIGTEHLKLKPADRQQGPHVYASAARASISAFCFSFFSFLFYRVKSLSRAASGMRFSCHTSSVLVK